MADSSACEAGCSSKKDAKDIRKCTYKCRKEAYDKCIKSKKCPKCSMLQEAAGALSKKAKDASDECYAKRKECLAQCGTKPQKDKRYAPEPSSQYELDSFEIGTESAICENCGEIHGLDEYEFGAHDEYEEVASCNFPDKKVKDGKNILGLWKYKCVRMSDREQKAWLANPNFNKKLPQASKKGKAGGATYETSKESKERYKAHGTAMKNETKNIDKKQKKGTNKNTMTFGQYGPQKFTSEPIPDYIMRALKPKKSVHPEYGKLRY